MTPGDFEGGPHVTCRLWSYTTKNAVWVNELSGGGGIFQAKRLSATIVIPLLTELIPRIDHGSQNRIFDVLHVFGNTANRIEKQYYQDPSDTSEFLHAMQELLDHYYKDHVSFWISGVLEEINIDL
jgi:hypothetical protein